MFEMKRKDKRIVLVLVAASRLTPTSFIPLTNTFSRSNEEWGASIKQKIESENPALGIIAISPKK